VGIQIFISIVFVFVCFGQYCIGRDEIINMKLFKEVFYKQEIDGVFIYLTLFIGHCCSHPWISLMDQEKHEIITKVDYN